MSRRFIIPIIVVVLVVASLAAVAAVATTAAPLLQVVPQLHKEGGEGYFRVSVPLPEQASPLPTGLTVKVVASFSAPWSAAHFATMPSRKR